MFQLDKPKHSKMAPSDLKKVFDCPSAISELDMVEQKIKSLETVYKRKLYPFQKEILRKLLDPRIREMEVRATSTGRLPAPKKKSNPPKENK